MVVGAAVDRGGDGVGVLARWSNANCTSCLACSGGGGGDVMEIVSFYFVDNFYVVVSCYVVAIVAIVEWLNLGGWQHIQGRGP